MATIEFTAEELTLLKEILQARLKELEAEIHHTSSRDYRQMLKSQKDTLHQAAEKLCPEQVTA